MGGEEKVLSEVWRVFAKRLVLADEVLEWPVITVEDGLIADISAGSADEGISGTLTSGLLDIHMHGAVGHDVMEGTVEALRSVSVFLASRGVTEYLATTVTASLDLTLRALDGLADYIERTPLFDEARMMGIHIEGPFVSHSKRGMHPEQFILPPSVGLLEQLWNASRGHIRLMTIAPEVPGALETIMRAGELGIRSSIGHSNATRTETLAALQAGAVSATHTFNAMRALDHREPGILGVVLDCDSLFAELICDGVHVAPEMVRLWFKAKGPERAILITDSLEAAGMPDGIYKLGETVVNVKGGHCLTTAGVLAGSTISLDEAVDNMQKFTGADLATAVRLASRNPANMLGIPQRLRVGSEATFNSYDEHGRRQYTILRGQKLSGFGVY